MTIIGSTAGALIACVLVAARLAEDPGDALGFFGGALGAGLAVVGTLWLESRKVAAVRRENRKLLAQALMAVGISAHRFAQIPDVGVGAGILTFRQTVETFKNIADHVPIDDANGYLSMMSNRYWARVFDEHSADLYHRLNLHALTAGQVRADLAPKLASLASGIHTTLANPYWPPDSLQVYTSALAIPATFDPETGLMNIG